MLFVMWQANKLHQILHLLILLCRWLYNQKAVCRSWRLEAEPRDTRNSNQKQRIEERKTEQWCQNNQKQTGWAIAESTTRKEEDRSQKMTRLWKMNITLKKDDSLFSKWTWAMMPKHGQFPAVFFNRDITILICSKSLRRLFVGF